MLTEKSQVANFKGRSIFGPFELYLISDAEIGPHSEEDTLRVIVLVRILWLINRAISVGGIALVAENEQRSIIN